MKLRRMLRRKLLFWAAVAALTLLAAVLSLDCQKGQTLFDKRLAVCRAHNLFAESEQIPHLQTEKCFLRRTRRRKKRIALDLPPAGGKLCEAFSTS